MPGVVFALTPPLQLAVNQQKFIPGENVCSFYETRRRVSALTRQGFIWEGIEVKVIQSYWIVKSMECFIIGKNQIITRIYRCGKHSRIPSTVIKHESNDVFFHEDLIESSSAFVPRGIDRPAVSNSHDIN